MIDNKNFNTVDQKLTVKSAKNVISTNYLRKFKASNSINKNNNNSNKNQINSQINTI